MSRRFCEFSSLKSVTCLRICFLSPLDGNTNVLLKNDVSTYSSRRVVVRVFRPRRYIQSSLAAVFNVYWHHYNLIVLFWKKRRVVLAQSYKACVGCFNVLTINILKMHNQICLFFFPGSIRSRHRIYVHRYITYFVFVWNR